MPRSDVEAAAVLGGSTAPLAREVIAEQVVDLILSRIRSGELVPGQKLPTERELAASLGVGRPSLREALRALAILRVLDIRQGEGVFVSQLLPDQLLEPLNFFLSLNEHSMDQLFEARIVYESGITGIAARTLDSEKLKVLKSCIEEGEDAIDDPPRFLELDVTFHQTITSAVDNPFLAKTADAFRALTIASRNLTVTVPQIRRRSHEDHRKIFEALLYRDEDQAARAMAEHLNGVWREYRKLQRLADEPPRTAGSVTP
jgi:GntR family transcriptional repressor for pyruvate dehydrogenase complex